MTNNTNADLVAKAHDMELEGDESNALADQVVTFVGTQKAQFTDAIAAAQAQIDQLTATALPDADRQAITASLDTAKSKFDNMQSVLTALVTPPSEPLPEPAPEPTTGA